MNERLFDLPHSPTKLPESFRVVGRQGVRAAREELSKSREKSMEK